MKWNNKLNKRYTILSFYIIFTAIVVYCLSLLAKNAPLILSVILEKVRWFMAVAKPIVFAFVFAYLLDPLNDFLEEQFRKIKIGNKQLKSPRTWAVFTTMILIIVVISAIISILVFSVTNQLRVANISDIVIIAQSYMNTINDFIYSVKDKLESVNIQSEQINQYVTNATTYLMDSLKNMAESVVNSITNFSSYLTTFLFSVIIGIYFMIDGVMIKGFIRKVGRALLSDKWNKKVTGFIQDVDTVFSGYIRGQLADAAVMMMLISLTLSVIGVKFAILIGIFAGIGNLIPYCGPFIAYFSTILVCVINGQYKQLLIAVIILFIIQALDGNVISPKLLSKSIQIHPVLVVIFLVFGNAIGGLLGLILAVPVGCLVKLLFVRYIDHRLEKKEEEAIESECNKVSNQKK